MERFTISPAALEERIAAAIGRAERAARISVVLRLTIGHAALDELQDAAVSRLQAYAQPGDLVARVAGGELILVLEDLANNHEAHRAARNIFELAKRNAPVSAGFSIFPFTARTPRELIDAAGDAMRGVRAAGGNAVEPARPQVPQRDVSKIRTCATSFPASLHSGQKASGLASG